MTIHHLIYAGNKVRFTVCFGNLQPPAKLYGTVVTVYGRARADVLFEDAPKPTTVLLGDLVRVGDDETAEIIPFCRGMRGRAGLPDDGGRAA